MAAEGHSSLVQILHSYNNTVGHLQQDSSVVVLAAVVVDALVVVLAAEVRNS